MPPKSASKREQILWYLCEQCKANIASKDREQHDALCPLTGVECLTRCSFVRDHKFHSNQLNVKRTADDVRNLTAKQFSSLVFLSESVISLCGFILGQHVLVHSPQYDHSAPIVRCVWPLSNSLLTSVLVSEDGEPYAGATPFQVFN